MAKTEVMGRQATRGAWLYVNAGSQAGRDFRLGSQATLGRNSMECEIVLSDPGISDKHARIKREGAEFVLYDLASLNGTYLNDTQIRRQLLTDNDKIRIGGTELIFKVTPR